MKKLLILACAVFQCYAAWQFYMNAPPSLTPHPDWPFTPESRKSYRPLEHIGRDINYLIP